MSITTKNNVLIIGAGASADFGVPLGGPLLSEVRDELIFQANEMEEDLFLNYRSREILWFNYNQKRERTNKPANDYPIWLWLKENYPKVSGENHIHNGDATYYRRLASMMTSVADLLDEQTSETIDDFIAMNPASAEIVKLAIACVFCRIIFSGGEGYGFRKQIHTRNLEIDSDAGQKQIVRRNWIHLLINIVRHAVYNGSLKDDEKIRIISFNYDGILESVLDQQFGNTGQEFKPWRDYIEIIHPHGWMGDIPERCQNMKDLMEKWSIAINVVNEKNPNQEVQNARDTASKWIVDANEVYMAGFALSVPNAKLLTLGSRTRKSPQHWKIHNYDGSAGLKYTALSYRNDEPSTGGTRFGGLPPSAISISFEGGSKDEPMTIAQWFQTGIPGDMPG